MKESNEDMVEVPLYLYVVTCCILKIIDIEEISLEDTSEKYYTLTLETPNGNVEVSVSSIILDRSKPKIGDYFARMQISGGYRDWIIPGESFHRYGYINTEDKNNLPQIQEYSKLLQKIEKDLIELT